MESDRDPQRRTPPPRAIGLDRQDEEVDFATATTSTTSENAALQHRQAQQQQYRRLNNAKKEIIEYFLASRGDGGGDQNHHLQQQQQQQQHPLRNNPMRVWELALNDHTRSNKNNNNNDTDKKKKSPREKRSCDTEYSGGDDGYGGVFVLDAASKHRHPTTTTTTFVSSRHNHRHPGHGGDEEKKNDGFLRYTQRHHHQLQDEQDEGGEKRRENDLHHTTKANEQRPSQRKTTAAPSPPQRQQFGAELGKHNNIRGRTATQSLKRPEKQLEEQEDEETYIVPLSTVRSHPRYGLPTHRGTRPDAFISVLADSGHKIKRRKQVLVNGVYCIVDESSSDEDDDDIGKNGHGQGHMRMAPSSSTPTRIPAVRRGWDDLPLTTQAHQGTTLTTSAMQTAAAAEPPSGVAPAAVDVVDVVGGLRSVNDLQARRHEFVHRLAATAPKAVVPAPPREPLLPEVFQLTQKAPPQQQQQQRRQSQAPGAAAAAAQRKASMVAGPSRTSSVTSIASAGGIASAAPTNATRAASAAPSSPSSPPSSRASSVVSSAHEDTVAALITTALAVHTAALGAYRGGDGSSERERRAATAAPQRTPQRPSAAASRRGTVTAAATTQQSVSNNSSLLSGNTGSSLAPTPSTARNNMPRVIVAEAAAAVGAVEVVPPSVEAFRLATAVYTDVAHDHHKKQLQQQQQTALGGGGRAEGKNSGRTSSKQQHQQRRTRNVITEITLKREKNTAAPLVPSALAPLTVPYAQQGNPDLYTAVTLQRRLGLRHDPAFRAAAQRLWQQMPKVFLPYSSSSSTSQQQKQRKKRQRSKNLLSFSSSQSQSWSGSDSDNSGYNSSSSSSSASVDSEGEPVGGRRQAFVNYHAYKWLARKLFDVFVVAPAVADGSSSPSNIKNSGGGNTSSALLPLEPKKKKHVDRMAREATAAYSARQLQHTFETTVCRQDWVAAWTGASYELLLGTIRATTRDTEEAVRARELEREQLAAKASNASAQRRKSSLRSAPSVFSSLSRRNTTTTTTLQQPKQTQGVTAADPTCTASAASRVVDVPLPTLPPINTNRFLMDRRQFTYYLFLVADAWCESILASEYAAFLHACFDIAFSRRFNPQQRSAGKKVTSGDGNGNTSSYTSGNNSRRKSVSESFHSIHVKDDDACADGDAVRPSDSEAEAEGGGEDDDEDDDLAIVCDYFGPRSTYDHRMVADIFSITGGTALAAAATAGAGVSSSAADGGTQPSLQAKKNASNKSKTAAAIKSSLITDETKSSAKKRKGASSSVHVTDDENYAENGEEGADFMKSIKFQLSSPRRRDQDGGGGGSCGADDALRVATILHQQDIMAEYDSARRRAHHQKHHAHDDSTRHNDDDTRHQQGAGSRNKDGKNNNITNNNNYSGNSSRPIDLSRLEAMRYSVFGIVPPAILRERERAAQEQEELEERLKQQHEQLQLLQQQRRRTTTTSIGGGAEGSDKDDDKEEEGLAATARGAAEPSGPTAAPAVSPSTTGGRLRLGRHRTGDSGISGNDDDVNAFNKALDVDASANASDAQRERQRRQLMAQLLKSRQEKVDRFKQQLLQEGSSLPEHLRKGVIDGHHGDDGDEGEGLAESRSGGRGRRAYFPNLVSLPTNRRPSVAASIGDDSTGAPTPTSEPLHHPRPSGDDLLLGGKREASGVAPQQQQQSQGELLAGSRTERQPSPAATVTPVKKFRLSERSPAAATDPNNANLSASGRGPQSGFTPRPPTSAAAMAKEKEEDERALALILGRTPQPQTPSGAANAAGAKRGGDGTFAALLLATPTPRKPPPAAPESPQEKAKGKKRSTSGRSSSGRSTPRRTDQRSEDLGALISEELVQQRRHRQEAHASNIRKKREAEAANREARKQERLRADFVRREQLKAQWEEKQANKQEAWRRAHQQRLDTIRKLNLKNEKGIAIAKTRREAAEQEHREQLLLRTMTLSSPDSGLDNTTRTSEQQHGSRAQSPTARSPTDTLAIPGFTTATTTTHKKRRGGSSHRPSREPSPLPSPRGGALSRPTSPTHSQLQLTAPDAPLTAPPSSRPASATASSTSTAASESFVPLFDPDCTSTTATRTDHRDDDGEEDPRNAHVIIGDNNEDREEDNPVSAAVTTLEDVHHIIAWVERCEEAFIEEQAGSTPTPTPTTSLLTASALTRMAGTGGQPKHRNGTGGIALSRRSSSHRSAAGGDSTTLPSSPATFLEAFLQVPPHVASALVAASSSSPTATAASSRYPSSHNLRALHVDCHHSGRSSALAIIGSDDDDDEEEAFLHLDKQNSNASRNERKASIIRSDATAHDEGEGKEVDNDDDEDVVAVARPAPRNYYFGTFHHAHQLLYERAFGQQGSTGPASFTLAALPPPVPPETNASAIAAAATPVERLQRDLAFRESFLAYRFIRDEVLLVENYHRHPIHPDDDNNRNMKPSSGSSGEGSSPNDESFMNHFFFTFSLISLTHELFFDRLCRGAAAKNKGARARASSRGPTNNGPQQIKPVAPSISHAMWSCRGHITSVALEVPTPATAAATMTATAETKTTTPPQKKTTAATLLSSLSQVAELLRFATTTTSNGEDGHNKKRRRRAFESLRALYLSLPDSSTKEEAAAHTSTSSPAAVDQSKERLLEHLLSLVEAVFLFALAHPHFHIFGVEADLLEVIQQWEKDVWTKRRGSVGASLLLSQQQQSSSSAASVGVPFHWISKDNNIAVAVGPEAVEPSSKINSMSPLQGELLKAFRAAPSFRGRLEIVLRVCTGNIVGNALFLAPPPPPIPQSIPQSSPAPPAQMVKSGIDSPFKKKDEDHPATVLSLDIPPIILTVAPPSPSSTPGSGSHNDFQLVVDPPPELVIACEQSEDDTSTSSASSSSSKDTEEDDLALSLPTITIGGDLSSAFLQGGGGDGGKDREDVNGSSTVVMENVDLGNTLRNMKERQLREKREQKLRKKMMGGNSGSGMVTSTDSFLVGGGASTTTNNSNHDEGGSSRGGSMMMMSSVTRTLSSQSADPHNASTFSLTTPTLERRASSSIFDLSRSLAATVTEEQRRDQPSGALQTVESALGAATSSSHPSANNNNNNSHHSTARTKSTLHFTWSLFNFMLQAQRREDLMREQTIAANNKQAAAEKEKLKDQQKNNKKKTKALTPSPPTTIKNAKDEKNSIAPRGPKLLAILSTNSVCFDKLLSSAAFSALADFGDQAAYSLLCRSQTQLFRSYIAQYLQAKQAALLRMSIRLLGEDGKEIMDERGKPQTVPLFGGDIPLSLLFEATSEKEVEEDYATTHKKAKQQAKDKTGKGQPSSSSAAVNSPTTLLWDIAFALTARAAEQEADNPGEDEHHPPPPLFNHNDQVHQQTAGDNGGGGGKDNPVPFAWRRLAHHFSANASSTPTHRRGPVSAASKSSTTIITFSQFFAEIVQHIPLSVLDSGFCVHPPPKQQRPTSTVPLFFAGAPFLSDLLQKDISAQFLHEIGIENDNVTATLNDCVSELGTLHLFSESCLITPPILITRRIN